MMFTHNLRSTLCSLAVPIALLALTGCAKSSGLQTASDAAQTPQTQAASMPGKGQAGALQQSTPAPHKDKDGKFLFEDNASISTALDGAVEVSGRFRTTVNMVKGAAVHGAVHIDKYSTLNIVEDAVVNGPIELLNNSTVNISKGAAVNGSITTFGNSTLNINGGDVDKLHANDPESVSATGNSKVAIHGGRVFDVDAAENSSVLISGGDVGEVEAHNNATVTVTGSTARGVFAIDGGDNSTIILRGGNIYSSIALSDKATLHVYGTGLKLTHADKQAGHLSGTLEDGTVLNNREVFDEKTAKVVLHNLPAGK